MQTSASQLLFALHGSWIDSDVDLEWIEPTSVEAYGYDHGSMASSNSQFHDMEDDGGPHLGDITHENHNHREEYDMVFRGDGANQEPFPRAGFNEFTLHSLSDLDSRQTDARPTSSEQSFTTLVSESNGHLQNTNHHRPTLQRNMSPQSTVDFDNGSSPVGNQWNESHLDQMNAGFVQNYREMYLNLLHDPVSSDST